MIFSAPRSFSRGALLAVAVLISSFASFFTEPLAAQERILSYDIEVDIRDDGSLDVVERILVRAEGQNIRRGIYRDFPTRYRDRYGNRMRVAFEVVGVERNGAVEDWFTEGMSNGVRVNTGGDDFLPVPADYEFTLRYRTTRQLGFFADHDELYWNAIGTGWDFAIERGSVVVRLPQEVPQAQLAAEAYTGPQGAQGSGYTAEVLTGGARYTLTQALAPREGLTIVLSFPKGIVPAPSAAQRARWFFADNRGVLIALVAFLAVVAICLREWWRVGRGPAEGVIIPRYTPREGVTPAVHRYLRRMAYDTRCFSSDVLQLAVLGHLRIDRDEGFLKDVWSLVRTQGAGEAGLPPAQDALLSHLFRGGRDKITLKPSNAEVLSKATEAHRKALDRELTPRYFKRNARSLILPVAIAMVGGVGALLVSGGSGIAAIVVLTAAMVIGLSWFARVVKAPTPEGRTLLDEIAGVELYLTVAEKDELGLLPGPGAPPPLDAVRYEALLPYAVALKVEDAWTEKFTAAVGAAAAAEAASRMTWYGGHGPIGDLGSFSHAIGSSLSSSIASASSPPGSSSGGGGGGSSGGGGGGGGGGGR